MFSNAVIQGSNKLSSERYLIPQKREKFPHNYFSDEGTSGKDIATICTGYEYYVSTKSVYN
jgi:hypothetical protein